MPTVGNPCEIRVRWNDIYKEVRLPDGTTITITAELVLDRVPPIGSALWRGSLKDLALLGKVPPSNVMEVISYNSVPDLKNRATAYNASLQLFRGTLPTTQT